MKFKLLFLLILFSIIACNDSWLEAKRDLNSVLPISLKDLDAILHVDYSPSISDDIAGLSLLSSDDYYIHIDQLNAWGKFDFNTHTWASSLYESGSIVDEWNGSYEQVLYSNVVLEKHAKIQPTASNATLWNRVRGGALFFRAKAFFNIARQFAPPYNAQTADKDYGIPLRLVTDPNIGYTRASVSESYELIIKDLKEAASLLYNTSDIPSSPSKPGTFGLLARVYLSMREYHLAGLYADSCLRISNTLMNYNEVQDNGDGSYPFNLFNPEVISHSYLNPTYGPLLSFFGVVNPSLLGEYNDNDLRKTLFFNKSGGFRGNYTADEFKFSGISTSEILLIRAECFAREGRSKEALIDLNRLLNHRYKTDTFLPFDGLVGETLLSLILMERRKELVFRGERWSDLRRLNQESGHETTLYRDLNNVQYELPPEDPRYTFAIPDYVIQASGIPQNIR